MSERDRIRQSVERNSPESMQKKRTAPKPPPTKKGMAEQEKRIGKPTSFRLSIELREALDAAAGEYGVAKRDLVEFLLRAGLELIELGRVELPTYTDTGPQRIRQPDIPGKLLR